MALQWTPLRPQTNANVFSKVRQSVDDLEHMTQSKVLLQFKLMVSGNGTQPGRSESPFTHLRSPRKMTDRAVQCDEEPEAHLATAEPTEATEPPEVTEPPEATAPPTSAEPSVTTIAEINTSEPNVSLSRPLSVEFTNSLGRERRRTVCENVDEIVAQPINSDAKTETDSKVAIVEGKCELDGVKCNTENACCVDCLYFTMKCCECTII